VSVLIAGRYRLESKIASGGMGEVWTAHDQTLGRRVAVKLLRDSLAEDRIVAERFRREALTAASLSHPNMAEVYDYVEDNGRPGIVMELVDGETLADRLRRGRLDTADAVHIGSQVLEALQAAHEHGVVHRDVKPGNIMLTPKGKVKVTDFGIARAEGDSTLTEAGAVMGTAHYASPEQVQGRGATPASDLYSLGIVLYEALTGRRPFEAETPVSAALARLTMDPPRPRTLRADIPIAVEAATMRALEREPTDRYPTAAAMRQALTDAIATADTEAMATQVLPVIAADAATGVLPRASKATTGLPGAPIAATPPKRKRRWSSAVAILVALGLLVAATGLALILKDRGPTMVTVPRLQDMNVGQALTTASRLGLQLDLQQANSSAPDGTVLRQSPAPGTQLAQGQTVSIVVSKGPPGTPCCTVPDLSGLTEEEAAALLSSKGLQLGDVTSQTRSDVRAGTVIGQDPPPGRVIAPGETVAIVIAKKSKGKDKGGNRD
jgi:eukaryotic-like serine/threonine-protein kinase